MTDFNVHEELWRRAQLRPLGFTRFYCLLFCLFWFEIQWGFSSLGFVCVCVCVSDCV